MSQSTSTPAWPGKPEFDSRVKVFSEALRVDEAIVREVLAEDFGADGESEQSLTIVDSEEFLPFGDLRQVFVEKKKLVKLAVLRVAMPNLRGRSPLEVKETTNGDAPVESSGLSDVAASLKYMAESNRRKEDMDDASLLKFLAEGETETEGVLSKRTRGRPCIVFDRNGNVNIEASLPLVKLARKQPTNDQHRIAGKFVRVYRVGSYPDQMLDESPFARGQALVDGYCGTTDTDWSDVCHEARVLAHIHLFHCEKGQPTSRELKKICEDAKIKDAGLLLFRENYGKAAMLYGEMQTRGELPTLKIATGSVKQTAYAGRTDRAGME